MKRVMIASQMCPVNWKDYYFKFKNFQQEKKKYSQKERTFIIIIIMIIGIISMIKTEAEAIATNTAHLKAEDAMAVVANFEMVAMKQNTNRG